MMYSKEVEGSTTNLSLQLPRIVGQTTASPTRCCVLKPNVLDYCSPAPNQTPPAPCLSSILNFANLHFFQSVSKFLAAHPCRESLKSGRPASPGSPDRLPPPSSGARIPPLTVCGKRAENTQEIITNVSNLERDQSGWDDEKRKKEKRESFLPSPAAVVGFTCYAMCWLSRQR